MKKSALFMVTLLLCLILAVTSMAEGVLPALSDAFGKDMPTLRKILMRDPDAATALADGGTEVTFFNVTEDEYNRYSLYLGEFGCTLAGYTVDGTVMTARVEKNVYSFSFSYDYADGTAVVVYPSNTKEEDFDVAAEIVAQREADIKAAYQPGNYVTFGSYPQGADGEVEPIEWLVLEAQDGKALLISRYGLDAKPYNTEYANVTWENCTLRAWLNGEFLTSAFSAAEQEGILLTDVDNSSSQGYSKWSTDGGNNTQDKLFLLSYAEANKYFNVSYTDSNNTKARVQPTAYALAQGAYTNSDYKTAGGAAAGWWWLRSPGGTQHFAASVDPDGSLDRSSVFVDSACVRPAFWLNLESSIFQSYITTGQWQ